MESPIRRFLRHFSPRRSRSPNRKASRNGSKPAKESDFTDSTAQQIPIRYGHQSGVEKQKEPSEHSSARPSNSAGCCWASNGAVSSARINEKLYQRGAASEENLTKPVLSDEMSTSVVSSSYSQDYIGPDAFSQNLSRQPSYLRVSYALSGYKNHYRSRDWSASPTRINGSPRSPLVPTLSDPYQPSSTSESLSSAPKDSPLPVSAPPTVRPSPFEVTTPRSPAQLPMSMVERRLHQFEQQKQQSNEIHQIAHDGGKEYAKV